MSTATRHAWFHNHTTGEGRWELDEIIYRSPEGDLLEVQQDLASLQAQRDGTAWRQHWDARSPINAAPDNSGVWAKRELVLPDIPLEHIVTLGEGWSPLTELPRLTQHLNVGRLAIKQCGTTHTGSFKDLGMTVLVSQVNHIVQSGKHEILGVACASTGDTSAALAAYCATAGLPSVVLIPAGKISPAQLVQPMSNGSLTLALETDFDGCMRLVQELTADRRLYLANSMNSLRIEGQKTVGMEIVQQRGWQVPDWLIIPGGNLGNVSALYKGLNELLTLGVIDRLPRIACAQAAAANPLYTAYHNDWHLEPITASETQASAIRIGSPVSAPKAMRALQAVNGVVEEASEQEIADACVEADLRGAFACPHTGVALAAVKKLRAAGTITDSDDVVVISTAHGLKFGNVKAAYHANTVAHVEADQRNEAVQLPATTDAVYEAVERHRAAMA
jgi:threonine synthase